MDRYGTVFGKTDILSGGPHLPFGVMARAIPPPQFFDTRLERIFVKVNLGGEDIEHTFQMVFRWNFIDLGKRFRY